MKFLLCRAIRRASFTHSSKLEKVEGLKKMTAIYVALVVYMVVLFGVGLFYSKKNATINDFLLAGRPRCRGGNAHRDRFPVRRRPAHRYRAVHL